MQETGSKVKIFAWQEYKQKKNRLTTVKLESKIQAKKVVAQREELGREVRIGLQGEVGVILHI